MSNTPQHRIRQLRYQASNGSTLEARQRAQQELREVTNPPKPGEPSRRRS